VIQGKSCTGSAAGDPVYNLNANNLTLQKQYLTRSCCPRPLCGGRTLNQ
jgi:hypothetical protein